MWIRQTWAHCQACPDIFQPLAMILLYHSILYTLELEFRCDRGDFACVHAFFLNSSNTMPSYPEQTWLNVNRTSEMFKLSKTDSRRTEEIYFQPKKTIVVSDILLATTLCTSSIASLDSPENIHLDVHWLEHFQSTWSLLSTKFCFSTKPAPTKRSLNSSWVKK